MEKLKTYQLYSRFNTHIKSVKAHSKLGALIKYFETWNPETDKWAKYAVEANDLKTNVQTN